MIRLVELLLRLYPRSFRQRFSDEWREVAAWHRGRLKGSRLGGFRVAGILIRDTVLALPPAYWRVMAATRFRPESVARDFRHAIRSLARSPVFTITAVTSLGLGIGANTAIFSVINAILLEPLPYPHGDRLTIVWNEFTSGWSRLPLSPPEVAELADEPGLFEAVGGVWATSVTVTDDEDRPVQVPAGRITAGFLDVLGVSPAMGRSFTDARPEGARPPGVIISHELWQGSFAADPDIVGRSLRIDGAAVDVIGVMPAGFKLLFPPDGSVPERLDVFVSLPWNLRNLPPDNQYLRVVGRLAPGSSLAQAQRALDAATVRVHSLYPQLAATGDRFTVLPLHADAVHAARPALLALLAGVGLFLLLASANVASLVLARSSVRQREMAVRASLGATRRRLAQLLFLESLVIGLLATGLGLFLGDMGSAILWALRPEGIARVDSVTLNGTVVAFTLAVSLVATVLVGLTPLGLLGSVGEARTLRVADGRTLGVGRRAREWVTVGEVAIGIVLLVGTSLMGQTLTRLARADLGFVHEGLLTFRVSLSLRQFPTAAERSNIASEIDRRLSAMAGVTGAGATSHVPLGKWANWADAAPPEGVPENQRDAYFADHRSVTPGYFHAIGATLVEGRLFDDRDDAGSAPVVIIDRTLAKRAFPNGDAVGSTLYPARYVDGDFVRTAATVVGVVDDIRDVSPARPSTGQLYWPFAQSARWELSWVVRTRDRGADLLPLIRDEVRAVSPDLAVASVAPMDELLRAATDTTRFVALLGGVFSLLALCLAALGLYGVISYITVCRNREFGLMMVLGARPESILREVIGKGLALGGAGVATGVVAALGLTRFLSALLYEVSPMDAATFAGVALLFLTVVLVASLGPALRAFRVDPCTIMRE